MTDNPSNSAQPPPTTGQKTPISVPSRLDGEVRLDANRILQTAEQLSRRISERFPAAGLNEVCQQLLRITRKTQLRAAEIARPLLAIRFLSALLIVGVFGAFFGLLKDQQLEGKLEPKDLIQVLDAGFNILVLTGAILLFLITLERRVKRRRALKAIHELRSLAHIIDMHQLTKDPERNGIGGKNTQSSPKRTMSLFELDRYLDYCSEMLSLAGKIAVLYVQDFEDGEAVAAVNDLEDLTSGLSRKIWQKIMIVHGATERERNRT